MRVPQESGRLYLVATPIGNLGDMTQRALDILARADWVAAEDTRHTGRLLQHFGLSKRLVAVHQYNESGQVDLFREALSSGQVVALVSDAGTPLISDPGFPVVRALREAGFEVSPVPGACALVAALSASGLPCDRFSFEGFLPAKAVGRRKSLEALADESRTLVFYESPHRIDETLRDMGQVLGGRRQIVLAREMTKTFETFLSGTADELLARIEQDANQRRGEFVVLVEGAPVREAVEGGELAIGVDDLLAAFMPELPLKKLASIVSGLSGLPKNDLYKKALELKSRQESQE